MMTSHAVYRVKLFGNLRCSWYMMYCTSSYAENVLTWYWFFLNRRVGRSGAPIDFNYPIIIRVPVGGKTKSYSDTRRRPWASLLILKVSETLKLWQTYIELTHNLIYDKVLLSYDECLLGDLHWNPVAMEPGRQAPVKIHHLESIITQVVLSMTGRKEW